MVNCNSVLGQVKWLLREPAPAGWDNLMFGSEIYSCWLLC